MYIRYEYVLYMGMECIIHVMDYTCYVSVKHTCIDTSDYLRRWLYLEGVRRRTTADFERTKGYFWFLIAPIVNPRSYLTSYGLT